MEAALNKFKKPATNAGFAAHVDLTTATATSSGDARASPSGRHRESLLSELRDALTAAR